MGGMKTAYVRDEQAYFSARLNFYSPCGLFIKVPNQPDAEKYACSSLRPK